MNRQEKIQIIEHAIQNVEICYCFFVYDENYYHYYPNAVNEKFILGQEEDDFLLDGYTIRKISHLKKVGIKDDKCNEINKELGTTKQIEKPPVDISSWQTIFQSLKALNELVIIEDEYEEFFAIGFIEKVLKNKVYFREFDANGVWSDFILELPYSTITCVKWNTRYDNAWKKHLGLNG